MTLSDISRRLPTTTTLPTLGGESQFTVLSQGGAVVIINSSGTAHTLDDALVAAVGQRYVSLSDGRKLMAGEYVDPNWSECPNRIFAPYVARLIDYLQPMNHDIAQQIATLINTQNKLTFHYDAEKILQSADCYIYRLGKDSKVVGALEVKKVQWYQCEIDHLSVSEKRLGIGSSLLDEALAKAQKLGGRVAQCTVRVGNAESEGFFKKHGFTPTVTFLNRDNGNRVTVYQKALTT